MAWDLRGALLRKQEVESARLADFEFRLRVRTMRLLAPTLGGDPDELARLAAQYPDKAILMLLADRSGIARAELAERHADCRSHAREQLIRERGDPAPYPLA